MNEDCWDKAPIDRFRVLEFDDLLEGRCAEMNQVQEKSLFSVLRKLVRRLNALLSQYTSINEVNLLDEIDPTVSEA